MKTTFSLSSTVLFSEINNSTISTSRTSKLICVKVSASRHQVDLIILSITFGLIAIHIFLKTLASTLVLTMFKAMNLMIKRITMREQPIV